MHRIIPLIITLLSLIASPAVSSAVTSRFGGFGGDFHVAPPQSSPSAPVASPTPLFYASVEQSDAWNTRANGFYSFAADGRGFSPVGPLAQEAITVTDGAVYHDGRIYYLRKTVESLFRYSLDWTVIDAETFEVISRTARNGLSLAFDMTFDTTTQTCFAASPRSYSEPRADLRRVDLATGEFTTIAQLDVCIRAITADSQGRLWGLGNEVVDGRTTTFFYNINKETGALTRIGDVGYTMQETDAALVCDLRDDCIYWAAHTYTDDEHLQRTYRRGLATIDTETGRATFVYDFPANEKLSSLIINTDHPAGFSDPTPLPVTNLQLTPKDAAATAVLTWTAPTACVDRVTPLDPTRLTYTVTRRNDGRIIAQGLTTCRYEDTPDFPMQRVGYTVTAVLSPEACLRASLPLAPASAANPASAASAASVASLSSEAVQSPLYAIGRPHTVPYLETFDSYNAFYTYTLYDANGDYNEWAGNGWFYDQTSQSALYYTTLSRPADDWLVTPTLTISPDRVYRLRFGTYGYMGQGARNTFEVALATDSETTPQSTVSASPHSPAVSASPHSPVVSASLQSPVVPSDRSLGAPAPFIFGAPILTDTYLTEPTSPAFNAAAQPRWYTLLFHPEEGQRRIAIHNISPLDDHMFVDNIYIEDLGPATNFDLDHLNDAAPNPDLDLDRFDDDVLRYVNDLTLTETAETAAAALAPATAAPAPATAALAPAAATPPATPAASDGAAAPTSAAAVPAAALTWSPATTLPRLKPALQNCDALPPFTLDGGEGWTTYDADGARTIGIGTNQGALEWPHTTEAQAFIVFNPYRLGVESIIAPHSGEQCFISFAAAGRASDDWLISPLLSGQQQRFSFWAKCLYPECLNELFEVWASYESPVPASAAATPVSPAPVSPAPAPVSPAPAATPVSAVPSDWSLGVPSPAVALPAPTLPAPTPAAPPASTSIPAPVVPSDWSLGAPSPTAALPAPAPQGAPRRGALAEAFRLAGPITVSSATEWTEYSFTLPEGVRYVMIRCTSDSQFGLMIDDLTFPAAPAPTEFWGYNIYCDGQLIVREHPTCTFPLTVPMAAGVLPPAGSYTVTAQYAEGESRPSNAVVYTPVGIRPPVLSSEVSLRGPAPRYDLQGRPAPSSARGLTITHARKELR